MARKPSSRVVLNRSKMTEVGLAMADGIEEVLKTIVEVAEPPDATPFGAGLVTRGGWLVYNGSKKVGGGGTDGRQPKKPRAFKVPAAQGIAGIAGFGFPGRFQEFGVIHHAAQPFFTPAVDATIPHLPAIMESVVRPRLKRL